MRYLLDANVFIEAKRRHYGLDFCPGFWEWLTQENARNRVFSIEKVWDELRAGDDELTVWAEERGPALFLPPDEQLLSSLALVSEWVREQHYRPRAIRTFLEDADYYLVAYAHAYGYVVVTHELPSDGEKRVKIPNVSIGMKVKCVNPFEMLRREQARFVLGSRQ